MVVNSETHHVAGTSEGGGLVCSYKFFNFLFFSRHFRPKVMSNPNHYSKWDKLDYGSDEDDKRKKGAFKKSGDGDPMKTEVDGTPFDVLMQQAVKMKTAQTAPDKKKFETWPRFYQNSVFSKEDVVAARLMDFDGRKEVAEKKKENGNDLLKKGKQMDANYQYEQCLAIWKWAENTGGRRANRASFEEDEQTSQILTLFHSFTITFVLLTRSPLLH